MMQQNPVEFYNLGKLGIIGMKGCEDIAKKIDMHLKKFNDSYKLSQIWNGRGESSYIAFG